MDGLEEIIARLEEGRQRLEKTFNNYMITVEKRKAEAEKKARKAEMLKGLLERVDRLKRKAIKLGLMKGVH